ncbi:MAG: phosphatidyl-myo-inositol alpha-mannosyltransferase [Thermoleophilaceae bacterium]|nr:phosphatidyl-myo-inositol alpha-mannosyltransferase [Thermoleophilaceae bacterium]
MSPQLKVALLAPCFWPEVRRGGERLIRDLADGLLADGHQPRLITSHAGIPRTSVEDGLPITRSWRPPGAGLLARRGFEDHLTHLPASRRILGRGSDDLAHAFYPTDAVVAARWAASTGKPAVQTYLGAPSRRWLMQRRRRLSMTLESLEGCSTVAISHAAAGVFAETLGREVRVIHPGVDLARFAASVPTSEDPVIFCAAAIDQPQKRVPLLVEAFGLVRRTHPRARLVLSAPSGPAVTQGLAAEGVELRNVDAHDDLVAAYSEAAISVLPSESEAFGLVMVESLACGTPVVGSRLGAIPEILDSPGAGVLFDGADPEALARALIEGLDLAADPATAAACRARAADFSIAKSTAAYESLYAELLA